MGCCKDEPQGVRPVDLLGVPRSGPGCGCATSDEEFSKKLEENNRQMRNSVVNEPHGAIPSIGNRVARKSDTLRYYRNLSTATVDKMTECRGKYIELARYIESLGNSRETSEAFTCLETSMAFALKHFCVTDPQAVQDEPFT